MLAWDPDETELILLKSWEEGKAEARAEGLAEGQAEGRAEVWAESVLTVLDTRGFAVPDAARERILAERDMTKLRSWLQKAAVASSIDDVIDELR